MKKTSLILFLSTILRFVVACNNDQDCLLPTSEPEDTVETIELNVPFLAKMGHDYRYIGEGDTLDLHLAGIFDGREYGVGCTISQGGTAEIVVIHALNGSGFGFKFYWPGCDGDGEYDISNPSLPDYQTGLTGGYTIKMMKMYPLSSDVHDYVPKHVNEYEIKLVILK